MTDKEIAEVDGEQVQIVRTRPMQLQTVADISDQTEAGLALFEERVRVARKQLALALRLTQPGQWVVMAGDGGKESVYATAGAADRILRMGFGMRWAEKSVTIEKRGDETIAVATAALLKPDGSIYEIFEGRRKLGGYVKSESDLVKSALANMAHQAVTQILGLRFLTPADLRELGLDLDKLPRRVEFQDHGEDHLGSPLVPFGKNKGKRIDELDDAALNWYVGAAKKNIADPEKAKWKVKEERWLAQLESEKARRAQPAPEKAPPPGPDMPMWNDREPGSEG